MRDLIAEASGHRAWRRRFGDLWTSGVHAFAFVVVPNLPYVLLMTEYELRVRTPLILLYWCVGVVAPKCPYWVVACAMAAVASLDLVWLVSGLFFLHPSAVVEAAKYALLIYPTASWLYLAIGAATMATIAVPAFLIHRRRAWFNRGRLLGVALMFAVVAADWFLTFSPPETVPAFSSAMRQTGIEHSDTMKAGGSLLIVMVESLGVFSEPAHNERLFERLESKEILSRYRVRRGVSPHFGATTGATSRELCGRWGTYQDYLSGSDFECLPARLAARGYATYAVYASTGRMFGMFDWYPNIGFAHLLFEEHMRARGAVGRCGAVFRSACDGAAAGIVQELLTTPVDEPRFVYWLTIDSHMPIKPTDGTPRWNCEVGGPFGDETVCLMAQIWADVIDSTVRLATDPDLGATTILLVGDHSPGFVKRSIQRYFLPGIVPWVALEPSVPELKTAGADAQRNAERSLYSVGKSGR